jgi:uncharacterized protein (DUF433 family)
MNTKLVESLVQVIESLPSEDYLLLQGQLTTRNIQKTEGVCGGYARIRNTRIPVWTIISLQHQGADDVELLRNFPSLTLFDLATIKAYYASHTEEIDRSIASHDEDDIRQPCIDRSDYPSRSLGGAFLAKPKIKFTDMVN